MEKITAGKLNFVNKTKNIPKFEKNTVTMETSSFECSGVAKFQIKSSSLADFTKFCKIRSRSNTRGTSWIPLLKRELLWI